MKIPGKELVIVLLGLVVLITVWVLVFTSTQERWRSESTEVRPEGVTESAQPEESAKTGAEEPAE